MRGAVADRSAEVTTSSVAAYRARTHRPVTGSRRLKREVRLYARVSTDNQSTDNQIRQLNAVASRHGWVVVGEYVDHAMSGAKRRERRPQYDQLLKAVTRKEFDIVAAWSVDRLGRSLQDLLGFLMELQGKGVDLYLHQQALDTSTPTGRAMFQMCGVFAKLERSIIRERVTAGLERARAQGKVLGRPRTNAKIEKRIRALLADGVGKGNRAEYGRRYERSSANRHGAAPSPISAGSRQLAISSA